MLREFKDANGTPWKVWDVYPHSGRGARNQGATDSASAVSALPSRALHEGWLVFECAREKRRLAPIPPEWETCEACVLEEFCGRAGFVTRLTPPTSPSTDS
jgi:hypothetical protein